MVLQQEIERGLGPQISWLKQPIRCVTVAPPKLCGCCPRNLQTFFDVKPGTEGRIVGVKFQGTTAEVWAVRLDSGISHLYLPREIRILTAIGG